MPVVTHFGLKKCKRSWPILLDVDNFLFKAMAVQEELEEQEEVPTLG